MDVLGQLRLARKRGVPLVGVETADQWAFVRGLVKEEHFVLVHDCIRGISSGNAAGMTVMLQLCSERAEDDSAEAMREARETFAGQPEVAALEIMRRLLDPEQPQLGTGYVVLLNAHRWVSDAGISQALGLLRETLKEQAIVLILCGPLLSLPIELRQDVLVLDEPLPNTEQLTTIVQGAVEAAQQACPEMPASEKQTEQAASVLRSLSGFAAEQAAMLSLKISADGGLDIGQLAQRRKKQLEQAKGVQVIEPEERFASLAGLAQGKEFLTRLMQGPSAPVAVAFVDELDKHMEGSMGGDLSGVSAGFLGATLTFMQDFEVIGILLYGIPGAGKSALAKAMAGEYQLPFLNLDFGAMRGGLVGESEENIRAAFKVAQSVSEKRRLLMIATCNRVGSLPPELEARFGMGSFFFDYPTPEAQQGAFKIWQQQFGLSPSELPDCQRWVGREIRQCCELAWRFGSDLRTASQYIVPGAIREQKKLEQLRQEASGRFLDIDRPGIFQAGQAAQEGKGGRKVEADATTPIVALVSPGAVFPSSEPQQQPSKKIGFGRGED